LELGVSGKIMGDVLNEEDNQTPNFIEFVGIGTKHVPSFNW
jgi:hypothetical protein